MKQLLITFMCIISLKCVAQKTITTYYDFLSKHKKETYTLNSSGEYHGKYTSYFEDGSINEERNYLNGKSHGENKAYYIGFGKRGLSFVHNYEWQEGRSI